MKFEGSRHIPWWEYISQIWMNQMLLPVNRELPRVTEVDRNRREVNNVAAHGASDLRPLEDGDIVSFCRLLPEEGMSILCLRLFLVRSTHNIYDSPLHGNCG